jgi:6-pyruvoyltetrahydropterin/6-carboxytetrahydropterin synthase
MFNVQVLTSFNAIHAVTIDGVDEIPHNHEWKVSVTLEGETLDDDGVLIDFLEVERMLADIIEPLEGTDLNTNSILGVKNPSAERVAMYIGDAMHEHISSPVRIQSVTVTEAPNCRTTYTL